MYYSKVLEGTGRPEGHTTKSKVETDEGLADLGLCLY